MESSEKCFKTFPVERKGIIVTTNIRLRVGTWKWINSRMSVKAEQPMLEQVLNNLQRDGVYVTTLAPRRSKNTICSISTRAIPLREATPSSLDDALRVVGFTLMEGNFKSLEEELAQGNNEELERFWREKRQIAIRKFLRKRVEEIITGPPSPRSISKEEKLLREIFGEKEAEDPPCMPDPKENRDEWMKFCAEGWVQQNTNLLRNLPKIIVDKVSEDYFQEGLGLIRKAQQEVEINHLQNSYSLMEVAEILEVNTGAINNLVRKGRLKVLIIYGLKRFRHEDVKRFLLEEINLEKQERPGRPRKFSPSTALRKIT